MRTRTLALLALAVGGVPPATAQGAPKPPGRLVAIGGGQRLHLHCTGSGAPTVILEAGAGDFSVIWSAVQERVSRFTRVCSYDRGGYAWSDPGHSPRTFGQLTLELHTLLQRGGVRCPCVLVGQSFGASLVRGYTTRHPGEVAGMVLVDAIHEDGYVFWGGEAHHLRDDAKGQPEPPPAIAIDRALLAIADTMQAAAVEPLEPPLDRMPAAAQRTWQWAAARPIYRLARAQEMAWSPDEAERTVRARRDLPQSLGDTPLIVLARTEGGYADGMHIPADSLERLRRAQQADLARMSSRGELRFAPHSGHNIHLEDPDFVAQAIHDVVDRARR